MWIDIAGLSNLRDLGGLGAGAGHVQPGRLWRSENHTGLSASARQELKDHGLSDVIDLRSRFEVTGSPSPFATDPDITYHHHSYLPESNAGADVLAQALPWSGSESALTADPVADSYLSFLSQRPGSVVAALRAIASAQGTAVVHCAVGKDRTGLTIALALALVGVSIEDVVADYALTTERILKVAERLWTDPTYAQADHTLDLQKLAARPEAMRAVFDFLEHLGGAPQVLRTIGWSEADDAALATRLLG